MNKETISELFMSKNRKIVISTIIFGIIHFMTQIFILIMLVGYGMTLFDNSTNYKLELFIRMLDILFNILSFPIVFICNHIETNVFYNFCAGWLPFVLNSILWSCIFYWLLKRLKKYQRKE